MNLDGILENYSKERVGRAPLTGVEVVAFHLYEQETWELVEALTGVRRVVNKRPFATVYESVDMGEREVDGVRKRVLIQPRVEHVSGNFPTSDSAKVELEAVAVYDDTPVTDMEGMLHEGNSVHLGMLTCVFGEPKTYESFQALKDFRELLQETLDAA